MRAPSRIVLASLALAALLFAGCTQESDSLTGPHAATPSAEKGIPAGYYDTVDETNATTLRTTLHAAIDDHTRIPYTSSATDTWNVLESADQDPLDSGRVLDVYMNESYIKHGAGNTDYNREHSWPKSYGFPNDGSSNYPYTDCHHLFISNDSRNSSRSNKPYGTAGGSGTEYVTVFYNGVGGGSGVYPGWSNWADTTYWETWMDRRGDVARAMFYMDVRYEGGSHGGTGHSEPDLILTDNLTLIENSNTGSNESVAYMGMLAVLLQWHADDPVDAKEQARNDAVYAHQGNRNPFIDHPEWVDCLFNDTCGGGGDTTPPAAPTGLTATGGDGTVGLDWADNGEGDLSHYTVYRATASGGPYGSLGNVGVSAFTDNAVTNGTTYYYVVTASDASSNESGQSAEASATPQGGGGGGGDPVAWINEFHYDNSGGDVGEFVEIAGTAGLSLSGWSVVGYNGNGGGSYKTVNLSGSFADQQGGFGTLSFAFTSMQNGAPDGLALIDGTGSVVQFLSYEGSFTATDGPANGTASVNVGVSETSSTAAGFSLQLAGTGSVYADFTWQSPQADTPGQPNTGQTFSGGAPVNQAPTANANGPYAAETANAIAFSSAGSSDSDGTITSYLWDFGDGNTSTAANPSHTYAAAGGYTVTLTVTDNEGATGNDTATATVSDPNAAPTALVNGPYSGDEDTAIAFSSAGSTDSDGTITTYAWTFGDGGTSSAANPSYTYADPGTYTVTLTVTDNDGATDQASTSATIANVNIAPTAVANGPYTGQTGQDVAFSSAGSSDSDGTITSYSWDFGDGGSATTANPTYAYATASTYTVTLTVTDNEGATDTATTSATIDDAPVTGDADVWINEFHYDNDGTDTGEFFEIAGATGTDLSGWSVVGYNGNGGVSYATVNLSGTLPATMGGFGVAAFNMAGMQNGSPDGLALIDGTGAVVQFLSYEGSFTAVDGPASGYTSTDIGVSEASTTTIGHSLQLGGTGYSYADFTWQSSAANTSGAVNNGQTLGDGSTSGGWNVITFDDFEGGWGNYVDGGGDCYLYTSGTRAHQGSNAGGIQDNSGTRSSFTHASSYDVSGYSDLEVEFWFYANSMESGEDFWVQYWDGSTWRTVATYARGSEFSNGQFYNEVVSIPAGTYSYPTDAKLRFRCDASGNGDDVYIDEVEFRGFN